MAKTNKFHVKEFEENRITVEEERKDRSPLVWFFIRNGRLIFTISLLFSLTVFIVAVFLVLFNAKDSSIVMYESNGVKVTFDGTDNSILNGTPITKDYASSLFSNSINKESNLVGVVVKLKEVELSDRKITFYSDKTALVEYKDGSYARVSSVDGDYGISEDGTINSKATVKSLTGEVKVNESLGITELQLSDGSMEVTKDGVTFFVRNSDVTDNENEFYTNLSGVSLPVKEENGKTYYSDGTVKEDDHIIVDGKVSNVTKEEKIHDDIIVRYYDNGYAEVVKDGNSIMVKNSDHVVYDDNILEIVPNDVGDVDIKDVMDIKDITLENTNSSAVHYIVVLEEVSDYSKYDVNKRLLNDYINFNVLVNGKTINNNILNNNLKGKSTLEGVSLENNTYLLDEGSIDKLSTANIKIGMWISYEDITNDYMNSAFIGTVKVYIESLD